MQAFNPSNISRVMDEFLKQNTIITAKLDLETVAKFFNENKNPSDDDFHKWAEENGFDVHKAEEIAYQLATKFAEFYLDGKSSEKKITVEDIDKDELAAGIKVEMEHTPSKEVATRIVLDHEAESKEWADPRYYLGDNGLLAWEDRRKKEKKK